MWRAFIPVVSLTGATARARPRSAIIATVAVCVLFLESPGALYGQGQPFVFPALLVDGKKVGDLVLGETTLDAALKIFPVTPPMMEGGPRSPAGIPRPLDPTKSAPDAKTVYNPWETMYALYFDMNRRLVIFDAIQNSPLIGLSRTSALEKFPNLHELHRDTDSYTLEGEIQPCVVLGLVLGAESNTVFRMVAFFTCPTKAIR